jgi:hypothetical protein
MYTLHGSDVRVYAPKMAIKPKPKPESRPIVVTIRLSKRAAEQLTRLSQSLNKSAGEIVEELITEEFKVQEKKNR